MRFGVREICNVTFRPLADLDIGSQHFSAYQPCLYIDTATASNMEVATTTVYAQGGRGNARLIAWEGEKTATFTVTDALLSPISFSMLSGAGVLNPTNGTKAVHLTVDGEINAAGTAIVVNKNNVNGYSLVPSASGASSDTYKGLHPYGMILDSQGQVVDYLGITEIDVNGSALETAQDGDSSDWTIPLASTVKTSFKGAPVRVDCYATTTSPVTTLTVDAENFGGTFYIEAETLFRDEATGHDFPATFIIPKGKISGNFTFNMASSGDPSTFDFQIDCTVGQLRTDKTSAGRVLYAIDIIDNISSSDTHQEHATIDPVKPTGITGSAFSG